MRLSFLLLAVLAASTRSVIGAPPPNIVVLPDSGGWSEPRPPKAG